MYKLLIMLLAFPPLLWSQSCQDNRIKLQVLGSGGPELSDGRVSSSHLIWVNDEAKVLVDLGGGSAHQFEQTGAELNDLAAILFTHLHVDHSADFPEFIKGFYFSERKHDLIVLGPAGNEKMPDTTEFVDQLFGKQGAYQYLNSYLNEDKNSYYKIKPSNAPLDNRNIHSLKINDEITAKSIAVNHGPIAAVAWRVEIGDCSITFSGDMSNQYRSLAILAQDTDLLVANNVIREDTGGIGRNLHMPPSEIGYIAKHSNPNKVLLAHFMTRSDPVKEQAVATIQKSYSGEVLLAEDLMLIDITSKPKQQPILNQGKKWPMDQHTREMFEVMSQRVDQGGNLRKLGAALNQDLNQLIQGCTMTGAAHDQLHVFLMPYFSAVKELSESGTESALKEVKQALDNYQTYFE
jgi:ribonuclease BN (tRNA processing enzyme)